MSLSQLSSLFLHLLYSISILSSLFPHPSTSRPSFSLPYLFTYRGHLVRVHGRIEGVRHPLAHQPVHVQAAADKLCQLPHSFIPTLSFPLPILNLLPSSSCSSPYPSYICTSPSPILWGYQTTFFPLFLRQIFVHRLIR